MMLKKALLSRLFIPISFLWFCTSTAQPDMVFFERFDEVQGLPNYLFTRIIQDRQGLLWMAGNDGLARYDGHKIMEFRHNHSDPHSISGNKLSAVYEDSAGHLWIGTQGAGVNVSDPTKSVFYAIEDTLTPSEKAAYMVTDITEDSSGRIWIASNLGLVILQEKNGIYTYSRDSEFLDQLAVCDEIKAPTVLKTGKDGKIWIGTDTGLCMYDPDERLIYCPEDIQVIPARNINDISFDRNDRLWVSCSNTGARLFYKEDDSLRFHSFDKIPVNPGSNTVGFSFDLDNRIWVSAFGRETFAYDFRDSTLFLQSKVNSNIAHERFLRKPFIDHSGDVWIPCEGFLIYRYPKGFSYYHHSFAFHQSNTAIFETGNMLWLAYREKGLVRLNENTGQADFFSAESSPEFRIPVNHIQKVSQLRNGNKVLVGFANIAILDQNDKLIRSITVKGTNRAMLEDSKGRIWIGGYLGLHLFSADTGVIHTYTLPLEKETDANFIQCIVEDANGNIWFGSENKGLGKLNPETGSIEQFLPESGNPQSLPSTIISDMVIDKSNILWLATDMSLVRFDPVTNSVKTYDRNHGLENDYICAVLADQNGFIWVSTHSGISRFDPAKEEFINYSSKDGLTNESYYRRNKFYSQDGVIFFGGKKGVDYFHPDHIRTNPTSPTMYLMGITIDNQTKLTGYDLMNGGEVKLTPSNNILEIEFIGLHYAAQDEVRYQYQLEGLNENWIDLGHERKILLTHMKPGDYTLRAKAITPDHITSSEELRIPIRVIPPFYATLWFRILGTLVLITAIIAYVQYREYSIKRKDRREADINQKINELEKRALQAQMNPHFIYNSMNSIQQFMISHDVEGAMKYLTRFSRVLRTVLNMSAENRIPLYDEIKLIEDYLELENMRFPNKFDYKINVSPELNIHTIEIPPFFIQPQVENAIRHGLLKKDTQGHLLVDIQKEGQYMRIVVEDNGVGREAAQASKPGENPLHESKGMAIVKERLKHLHSGNGAEAIRIIDLYNDSREAAGTRVEITLPLEED